MSTNPLRFCFSFFNNIEFYGSKSCKASLSLQITHELFRTSPKFYAKDSGIMNFELLPLLSMMCVLLLVSHYRAELCHVLLVYDLL